VESEGYATHHKYEDFGDEMTEREVIEVCNSAGIINGNPHDILMEKRKNSDCETLLLILPAFAIGQLQCLGTDSHKVVL
jgi:hypothetical protein